MKATEQHLPCGTYCLIQYKVLFLIRHGVKHDRFSVKFQEEQHKPFSQVLWVQGHHRIQEKGL